METKAVSEKTRAMYHARLEDWADHCRRRGFPLRINVEVDAALVDYLNAAYFRGHQPHVGEKLMAGLMDKEPRFSKNGGLRLPRA